MAKLRESESVETVDHALLADLRAALAALPPRPTEAEAAEVYALAERLFGSGRTIGTAHAYCASGGRWVVGAGALALLRAKAAAS
ncbi:MAG: hypothetical protein IH609_11890 [Dehalococcoidia bacterium]|nr:hypothetical protein [Dehalococcoidia bacterium]